MEHHEHHEPQAPAVHQGHAQPEHGQHAPIPAGLSLSAGGYRLVDVEAPPAVDEPGELRFRILDDHGAALVSYAAMHQRDMHLIVVRSDGERFRHVHPRFDRASGTWSLPWQWEAAGAYRMYADFAPESAGGMHEGVTLTSLLHVAGVFEPLRRRAGSDRDSVEGFDVALHGRLGTEAAGPLTLTVTRDGQPVCELEPYLGAFGHLVALRDGDLAFLHVHPEGDEPSEGEVSGPAIVFHAQAPTAGRYLLFLDFKVAGEVHSARFVVDAV